MNTFLDVTLVLSVQIPLGRQCKSALIKNQIHSLPFEKFIVFSFLRMLVSSHHVSPSIFWKKDKIMVSNRQLTLSYYNINRYQSTDAILIYQISTLIFRFSINQWLSE
ncbi:hypothetical protein PB70LOC_01485 [Pectobacterium versatile]|nr:hypothetical protein PB70LOC_01485 [Pectobacterium versatile]POY63340.1 hypothetical protein PB69LOC_01960 [Pectobacterium versatile]